jgi:hypothetical protein
MKTNVLDSSIECYHEDKMRQRDLTKRLLAYALRTKRFTARMAADHFGVETATMSGIIKPLIGKENGKGVLIRELTKHPCEVTGNRVYWLYHRDYTGQRVLFN